MSIKLITTKVEAYDEMDTVVFTLEAQGDIGVHQLEMKQLVCQESLGELFAAIREGVRMMDREKEVDGAE